MKQHQKTLEALKRGAKVIGGAPRYDKDGPGQIHRIFELAREYDVDIDMHLDVGHTAEAMNILGPSAPHRVASRQQLRQRRARSE